MRPRAVPLVLAAVVAGHLLGMLAFASVLHRETALPPWLETVYVRAFLLPALLWCWPWTPLLQRAGLVEGEWWRAPSLAGIALVDALYLAGLVALGLVWRRPAGRAGDA